MGKKSRKKRQELENNESVMPAASLVTSSNEKTAIQLQALFIFLAAILLYANTFTHQYAVDDTIVITKNTLTQQGLEGIPKIMTTDAFYGFFGDGYKLVAGGRYRPLSIVTFAIEVEIFGPDKPYISHMINVLLYGLLGVLLFYTLMLMFPHKGYGKYYLSIPFIAALLYIAHPIHTEAVANIKGRDEIMGMLGAIATLYFSLRYAKSEKLMYVGLAVLSFIFALLSKENPITFLAVVPLTYYFFTNAKVRQYATGTLPLLLVAVVYVILRQKFTDVGLTQDSSEILNNPFVNATTSERLATVAFTFWEYIRLLIFPHPLTYDYYYNQVPIIGWGSIKAILPFLLNVAILGWAIKGALSKNPFSYAILYYFITLSVVSNILFTVGIAMNERFVFMPSLGYCIILAMLLVMAGNYVAEKKWSWKKLVDPKVTLAVLAVILLGYSVKTITRNADWERDFTIFKADSRNSPNSAKVHNAYGGELLAEADRVNDPEKKKEYWTEAVRVQKRAIEIYPGYANAWLILGNAVYKLDDDVDGALNCYRKTLEFNPGYYEGNFNMGCVLTENGRHKESIPYFKKALRTKPEKFEAAYNMGEAYYKMNMPDSAIAAYQQVIALKPDLPAPYYKIGVAYGKLKNDLDNSIIYLEKAIDKEKNNAVYYEDLGVAYGFKNNYAKAIEMFEKAIAVNPDHAKIYTNLGVTYMKLGQKEKGLQNLNKAIDLLTKAINRFPENMQFYRDIISTYQILGNTSKAEEYYYKAIAIDPNFKL